MRDRVTAAIGLAGVFVMLVVWLNVLDDDFPNPDIAGIVYNAEALLRGELPYVVTAEIKPPGSFLLVAGSLAILGRDLELLQVFHLVWLTLGGIGVWWAVTATHADDEDHAPVRRAAALATAVYLVTAAMFSYNYSSWMTPAYAVAGGAALQSLRNRRGSLAVLAGAAAVFAGLTIQRGAVIGLVMIAWWAYARRRGWWGATARTAGAWALGGLATLLVVALPWILGGENAAFFGGIVPWAAASDYAAAADGTWIGNAAQGLVELVASCWFAAGLAAVAFAASRPAAERDGGVAFGAIWLLGSFVGVGLGSRYYLHYQVQYAPALAVLAGHPAVVRRVTALVTKQRTSLALTITTVAVAGLVAGQLIEIGLGRGQRYEARARRLTGGKTAAQAAGEHIRSETGPDETIMAWGWTAWRVYYWADRRAATRFYKPMGTVTTFNTNTAFDQTGGPRFRDGPAATALLEEFDRAPPTYFVYSPSMVETFGAPSEPLESFTALGERLRRDYTPEAMFGDLTLLRRRPDAGSTRAGG